MPKWDITGNCNLNCHYCREKDLASIPELTLPQIYSIIDQLEEKQVISTNLAGGEPLTFKQLPRVLKYLRNKVKAIGITTNGTLINTENVKWLKEFCNGVQVSLDGSNVKTHDFLRGEGTFNKAVNAIRILLENGIYTVARMTLTWSNLNDTGKYIELCHTLGLTRAYLRRVIPTGNSKNERPLDSDTLYKAYKMAYETGKKIGVHVGSTDYFAQIEFDEKEREKAEKNLLLFPEGILSGCSMGVDALYLSQDGKVLFCPFLPVYCGDLLKERLSDIWENSEMFKISRYLRWNLKGKCASCKYLRCCGGCPAYVFLTTGSIVLSDNGCWIDEPK